MREFFFKNFFSKSLSFTFYILVFNTFWVSCYIIDRGLKVFSVWISIHLQTESTIGYLSTIELLLQLHWKVSDIYVGLFMNSDLKMKFISNNTKYYWSFKIITKIRSCGTSKCFFIKIVLLLPVLYLFLMLLTPFYQIL